MKNDPELYKKICEYLGCDLDSEPCQQIKEYLAECPGCRVYVDKLKKTVNVYKTADNCDEIPAKVCTELFVSLNLDDQIGSDPKNDR